MSRIELPDGQWAETRDPLKTTNNDRKRFLRALPRDDDGEPASVHGLDSMTALAAFAVEAWSFQDEAGEPLPITPENIDGELSILQFDTLVDECQPFMKKLFPKFGVDGVLDPESPTEPSKASGRPAKGSQAPRSPKTS